MIRNMKTSEWLVRIFSVVMLTLIGTFMYLEVEASGWRDSVQVSAPQPVPDAEAPIPDAQPIVEVYDGGPGWDWRGCEGGPSFGHCHPGAHWGGSWNPNYDQDCQGCHLRPEALIDCFGCHAHAPDLPQREPCRRSAGCQ